jgi:hypothetical protein
VESKKGLGPSYAHDAKVEAIIADWEDTARRNLTAVGRAYEICARDMRRALGLVQS